MKIEGEQVLLRIFVGSNKKYRYLFPLYRYFVNSALSSKLAGLTVIKSVYGFLKNENRVFSESFLKSSNIIILEIVDRLDRLNRFLSKTELLDEAFVFSERAYIIAYRTKDEELKVDTNSVNRILKNSGESRRNMLEHSEKSEKILLRIFIGDDDRTSNGNYLYEWLIEKAKEHQMDIAVAIKGVHGFGKAGKLRALETIELSQDMPVIVEIISDEDKIKAFLKTIEEGLSDCLITLEKVTQLKFFN